MPQLMIDTTIESAESLRLLAVLLHSYAGIKDAQAISDRSAGTSIGDLAAASVAASIAQACTEQAVNPFAKPAVVPQGTESNILPFPLPLAPTTQTVVTPAALPPVSGMTVSAPVAGSPAITETLTVTNVSTGATAELDKANIPWDARIHQSNRNKKADGTWMLKRGLDKDLAASVLAELTAAKIPLVAPPIPVTLPPVDPSHHRMPVSLPTGNPVQLPGSILPLPPHSVPVSALPIGLPPVVASAALTPVQRFSAMMVKINAAKAAGQIDQSMIDTTATAFGLTQLPMLITQVDKIPVFEEALGI